MNRFLMHMIAPFIFKIATLIMLIALPLHYLLRIICFSAKACLPAVNRLFFIRLVC